MTEESKKGRKSLGKRSFTYAELRQRQRTKAKLLKEAMCKYEYMPVQVYVHSKQLEALSYIEKRGGGEGLDLIDPTVLSNRLFALMRDHIEENCNDLREDEPLKRLVDSGDLPHVSFHRIAQLNAQMQFTNWSKEHIEGLK